MENLTELFEKVGHLGELARLLSGFLKLKKTTLGKHELIELAKHTAGVARRYPTPVPTLELALKLGLVQQNGKFISLTSAGKLFIEQPSSNITELSNPQSQLLLSNLLDYSDIRNKVAILLREFHQHKNGRLEARSTSLNCEGPVLEILRILQQLGAIIYRDDKLVIDQFMETVLPIDLVESSVGLSEEALWKRLENQRLRALRVEEYVLSEERKRLSRLGRDDLAELVLRISKTNVSAGYDVKSFEEDGSPRYIEVKSSTGTQLRFEWSHNERNYAATQGRHYWIYFVPRAYDLQRYPPIFMIQNPIAFVNAKEFIEIPRSFEVLERQQSNLSYFMKKATSSQLILWTSINKLIK
jgi:hypothetical protein